MCNNFLTTHLIEELEDLINYLIVIDNGRIIYENHFDFKKQKIKNIYNKLINFNKIDMNKIESALKEIKNEN
ncbi:hypothetical protein [Spiroplasma taiwanense]|uniref:ABC transporter ATP-binding protein n=1 Tax=Spiroplasma taiwanense CT-1 TaxID=1276220 RepID=S5LW30_9MOLU|nr:hypothetical protein [Spiroplasma taiwanense]AGR40801.1 hypothetical protein STAIW_v1c01150 [Spiroplasma taiwanense CT-1]